MAFPDEWGPDGGEGGPTESKLIPLSMQSNEVLFIKRMLARSCPTAKMSRVQRVQSKKLWRAYANYRDEELVHSCGDGDTNEMFLFHGTAEWPAENVLAHPQGLDVRFSKGGFYGRGIYLAEDPAYVIGGRYAHRISGSGGRRVQLLVVRAALGSQQEMGQRISSETKGMIMPGIRLEGPPRVHFDSVRAGPHRPFVSGGGEQGSSNASILHVLYESRQMYPAYVIDLEMVMKDEVAAAVQNSSTEVGANVGPVPKRQRRAASSGAVCSSRGAVNSSGHAAAQITAAQLRVAPPNNEQIRAMDVAAVVTALQVHVSDSGFVSKAFERLIELCPAEDGQRQSAVEAGAIKAVVEALRSHSQVANVQMRGCAALAFICKGTDDAALARLQLALTTGAIQAVVAALHSHPQVARVQKSGCGALFSMCEGTGNAASAGKQLAIPAGAIEAVVAALRSHPQANLVQGVGCAALMGLCSGTDDAAPARRQCAEEAGAMEAVVNALRSYPEVMGVQQWGCGALADICHGTDAAVSARRQTAVQAGAITAVVAALRSHPQVANVQVNGCNALLNMCAGTDAAARLRKQQAVTAGASNAASVALQTHPNNATIQAIGQRVVTCISEQLPV